MAATGLSDADLHALVDGPLDASRRADLLRRAAASPRDRGLVEEWQDQSEWIRGAFAGVVSEPLPPALDLGRVRHLHVVPFEELAATPQAACERKARPWRSTAATLVVMALGLAGSWYVAVSPEPPDPTPDDRTPAVPLPTATIPDLSRGGFAFVGAERSPGGPSGLTFHYRRGASERIDVGVRRGGAVAAGGEPVSWMRGGATWTMSGTVAPERLRALAAGLRRDDAGP